MSDLDVIDARLHRVERHLGFVSAGTQAGHSHAPGGGAVHSDHESRDDAIAARMTSIEGRLDALAEAVEMISGDKLVDTSPPKEHAQAPTVGADNDTRRTTPKPATDDYGQPQNIPQG